jgi:hypothetical protein
LIRENHIAEINNLRLMESAANLAALTLIATLKPTFAPKILE